MNKKSLAKLLIKHPEIKALYESQEFDASIINKIIAEEIIREDDDEESDGRVSKAATQTRGVLDAEDDNNLEPIKCEKDDIACLKREIEASTDMDDLEELADEIKDDYPNHKGLINALKDAEKRIAGESTDTSKEDFAKKELIQSMQSEIEFLKSLLNDPEIMSLDKEEYEEAIDEYTKELEAMGVKVAETDSIEDDQAVTQALQTAKPAIEKAADAVKTAGEDDFAQKFADLDAAIMASLQKSKDAATAANDDLDLSDIEIGDEEPVNIDSTEDADLAEKPQEIKLDRSASKLQQLANGFRKLTDEQTARLAMALAEKKRIMALAKKDPLDYLPQEFKNFGESSAILMFEPVPDKDIVKLNPEISSFIKTVDDDGKPIEFEVDKQEIINSEKEITKMDKKLKEKKKMADKSKAVSSWANFKNNLKTSNVENKAEVLKKEVEKRLDIYSKANNWDDLAKPPLNHEISNDASVESFEVWRSESLPEIEDYFNGVLKRAAAAKPEEVEPITADIGAKIGTIDDAMNNVAGDETSVGDSDGSAGEAETDLETIERILPKLKGKFPNLFKFQGFVKNLGQALMGGSSKTSDADGDGVDANGTANSSGINIDSDIKPGKEDETISGDVGGLEESLSGIYLTEEAEVTDTKVNDQQNNTSGQPLDVADAATLKAELDELRKILKPKKINVEDLLTPDLQKALGTDPKEEASEIPSVEEAAEEGENAAQADAEQPDARYEDLYAGFKTQMDEFFSKDGANDGFMDQFLLKYQGAKLAALIGNLDLIIGGGTGKKDEEDEARAFSTATQQADANLNEEQGQEISEKGQLELKTRLVAMLKGLKSLRSMMNSYKKNATRSSANPKLDGSALKKSLQRYMSNLQINIKAIIETCYIEHSKLTQTQSDDVDLNEPSGDESDQTTPDDSQPDVQTEQLYEAIMEAMVPSFDGIYLMEDVAREEKMELVNTTYGSMMQIYESSMQSALERTQKETAMKNASQMMELAKKEEFVALFPTFTGSFGGKPQTIDSAVEAVDGLVKEFVETMKKVIVLAKGATIDETTLSKVIEDLSMMSLMMQNYFGAKSLLDDDMQAKVEKMLAQREDNQSLSDEGKPTSERSNGETPDKLGDLAGKAGELGGKALDKLKQMFSWMSVETRKLLLKFFGEDSKLIDGLSNSDLSDDEQEQIVEEVVESMTWFDKLDNEQKVAVGMFGNNLIQIRGVNEGYIANLRNLSVKIDSDKQQVLKAFRGLEKSHQETVEAVMSNDFDNIVNYLQVILRIKEELGEKAAEELVDSSQRNASNDPVDAEVEFEDDDNNSSIEGLPKAPTALKDRAIKMLEKKTGKSAPKPSKEGVSIFDYKSFASLLIFFMRQKNVNEEANAPSGKVNSGKDMETILKDGELSEQFFEVDDSLGGGLTKYAIKKYPFLSGVMSSLSKKFAPHFEKNNIELPNQTRPVQQQSDPSDIDPDADPFGDATNDQEPEDKPESKKIGLKDSLKKVSPRLRQKFISSKDVKADNLSATTKFLAIAVVNSVLTDAVDPNLGAEVDLDESEDRSLFASQVLNKMKNKKMVEKIKTFMIDVSRGKKTYVNLYNLYNKAIKPPESSYTKLAQYIDALTEKAKEVKKEGFSYKNAGNLTALNSDLATEKPKSFNLEESLRPIIEKMLNEHYNH